MPISLLTTNHRAMSRRRPHLTMLLLLLPLLACLDSATASALPLLSSAVELSGFLLSSDFSFIALVKRKNFVVSVAVIQSSAVLSPPLQTSRKFVFIVAICKSRF